MTFTEEPRRQDMTDNSEKRFLAVRANNNPLSIRTTNPFALAVSSVAQAAADIDVMAYKVIIESRTKIIEADAIVDNELLRRFT
jgi:hypothetical protein